MTEPSRRPDSPAAAVKPTLEKHEPMSVGDGKAVRKRKPRQIAFVTEDCSGCSGSPTCIEYCPIAGCMFWVPSRDGSPFGVIRVDPDLCIGCSRCVSKGPHGTMLDGCPWDAITMVPIAEWEAKHGPVAP